MNQRKQQHLQPTQRSLKTLIFYKITNDYYQHILRRFVLIIRHRAQLKYQKLLLYLKI